jgi:hypothetical protein
LLSPLRVHLCIRQHTSAYVSIRRHRGAFALAASRTPVHTSAYVSVRQHTSAYRSVCSRRFAYTCAYVSIRQRTSAYVGIEDSVCSGSP